MENSETRLSVDVSVWTEFVYPKCHNPELYKFGMRLLRFRGWGWLDGDCEIELVCCSAAVD
jgi:hypothetical protein